MEIGPAGVEGQKATLAGRKRPQVLGKKERLGSRPDA